MSKTFHRSALLAISMAAIIATTRRHMTQDVAYQYRMGGGFAGEVNRMHPASIEPCLINTTTPPKAYGHVVLADTTNGVRSVAAGDTGVTRIYGVAVRPYPTQQTSGGMSSSFGVAAPPTSGVLDVLRAGYITVKCVGTPKKDDPVFVWVAVDGSGNLQGQVRATASAGNTAAIANARFNGVPDADGVVEIVVWYA